MLCPVLSDILWEASLGKASKTVAGVIRKRSGIVLTGVLRLCGLDSVVGLLWESSTFAVWGAEINRTDKVL